MQQRGIMTCMDWDDNHPSALVKENLHTLSHIAASEGTEGGPDTCSMDPLLTASVALTDQPFSPDYAEAVDKLHADAVELFKGPLPPDSPIVPAEAIVKERVYVKRGDFVVYCDVQNKMALVDGVVIAVQILEVPHMYHLYLVRGKNRFDVIVHKEDWLRMADGVRNVENDTFATVESYMERMPSDYMTVASGTFGSKSAGFSGFSPEFIANRLWKPISGKKLKSISLTV